MKKFMSVTVTSCPGSCIHEARVAYSDDELGLDLSYVVSYEQGMIALRQLEKLLHRPARMIVNQFDPSISYKELFGYIDRE